MNLSSSCTESARFFMRNKRMFLDSCVLNEMSNNPEVLRVIEHAGKLFSTYISAISLLEVGFGPKDKADLEQQKIASNLYFDSNICKVSSSTIDTGDPINSDKKGKTFLYVPEEHEWFATRHLLIKWMENEKTGGSAARKQSNDALIFMCAWNANSFLVTDNIKDFTRFNRIQYKEFRGHLPIFTVDDLRRSKNEKVVFPENIRNYP